MTSIIVDLYDQARREFPMPIDIEKRMERYHALVKERHGDVPDVRFGSVAGDGDGLGLTHSLDGDVSHNHVCTYECAGAGHDQEPPTTAELLGTPDTHPTDMPVVPAEVHVRGGKALVVMSNGDSFMAPVKDTVACGACGALLPAIRTKAQRQPDSPQMQARMKHVTEECPSRVSATAGQTEVQE